MPLPTYNRVEFITDFGFGPVQAAFVDFSGDGISFGVPRNMKDLGLAQGDQFQRTTVHADGRVETHLPLPAHIKSDFDQKKSCLAQWKGASSWSFELRWDPESIEFMRQLFVEPKPSTTAHPRCLGIPIAFDASADNSTVCICIANPGLDVNELTASVIPGDGQLWHLTGGRPWVLVRMPNANYAGPAQLNNVGRDYRQRGQT